MSPSSGAGSGVAVAAGVDSSRAAWRAPGTALVSLILLRVPEDVQLTDGRTEPAPPGVGAGQVGVS